MGDLTTVLDVRDLDRIHLARIGGCDYYEVRQIVRDDGRTRQALGLASAWPVIKLTAENAELAVLLTASEERSADADCHVGELLARQSSYEAEIARLRLQLEQATLVPPAVALAATGLTPPQPVEMDADGRVACDYPGCTDRVKPRGLGAHKRRAHGIAGAAGHHPTEAAAPAWSCATCGASDDRAVADETRCKACVRSSMAVVSVPLAMALGEPPWRCENCQSSTHTRSLSDPARCMRCAADVIVTNGHRVAA